MRTKETNSDSNKQKYVHLYNGLIQSYEIRYVFRMCMYECLQVTVDSFCENIILVHCLVVVCNHNSLFFLCLREYVVISEFGSTVSCGLTRDRDYKAILTYTLTGLHEKYNP